MLEWFQSQIVSVFGAIIIISMFVAAVIFGVRMSGGNKVVGWIAGIVGLIVLVVLFRPLTEALSDKACDLNSEKCE